MDERWVKFYCAAKTALVKDEITNQIALYKFVEVENFDKHLSDILQRNFHVILEFWDTFLEIWWKWLINRLWNSVK